MIVRFIHRGQNFKVDGKVCGFFGKVKGLVFCRRENADALLFDKMSGGIHSFFVFMDFLAVWLDEENRVLEVELVKPWTSYVSKKGDKLLEIPINEKYSGVVKELVGKV